MESLTRTAEGMFIAIIIVVVVVVAASGLSASYQVGPCSFPVRPSPNGTGMEEVYQIAPGSFGVVCVNYQFYSSGTYSFPTDFGTLTTNSDLNSCINRNQSNGTVEGCSGLSIMPSHVAFNHLSGQNVTIAYTIQADRNVTGLYWFFIGGCDWIPVAIGPLPTSVLDGIISSCTSTRESASIISVVGVSNMNVALVPVR